MNRTTIPCPQCRHDDTDLFAMIRDDNSHVIGLRIHCGRCEHVWVDHQERTAMAAVGDPGHRSRLRGAHR